jgi:hypothetical protein
MRTILLLLLTCIALRAQSYCLPNVNPEHPCAWNQNSLASGAAAPAKIVLAASPVTGGRHVLDCISFSANSGSAPSATAINISIADGSTTIWLQVIWIAASAGQNVAPWGVCGLNLVGSPATAMTVQFSAGLANMNEQINISGYDR